METGKINALREILLRWISGDRVDRDGGQGRGGHCLCFKRYALCLRGRFQSTLACSAHVIPNLEWTHDRVPWRVTPGPTLLFHLSPVSQSTPLPRGINILIILLVRAYFLFNCYKIDKNLCNGLNMFPNQRRGQHSRGFIILILNMV